MPSAAWIPGWWVVVVLTVLAVVPIWAIFSRRFVRRILVDLEDAERRAQEGVVDLPEVSDAEAVRGVGPTPGKPL
jgi:hypothetical protein